MLGRWERGVGIPIVLPLAAVEPSAERADIVRHLKDARQKIDGADYAGSFAALARRWSSCGTEPRHDPRAKRCQGPGCPPADPVVIDALFSLASASPHVDGPIKDFEPMRADAVP